MWCASTFWAETTTGAMHERWVAEKAKHGLLPPLKEGSASATSIRAPWEMISDDSADAEAAADSNSPRRSAAYAAILREEALKRQQRQARKQHLGGTGRPKPPLQVNGPAEDDQTPGRPSLRIPPRSASSMPPPPRHEPPHVAFVSGASDDGARRAATPAAVLGPSTLHSPPPSLGADDGVVVMEADVDRDPLPSGTERRFESRSVTLRPVAAASSSSGGAPPGGSAWLSSTSDEGETSASDPEGAGGSPIGTSSARRRDRRRSLLRQREAQRDERIKLVQQRKQTSIDDKASRTKAQLENKARRFLDPIDRCGDDVDMRAILRAYTFSTLVTHAKVCNLLTRRVVVDRAVAVLRRNMYPILVMKAMRRRLLAAAYANVWRKKAVRPSIGRLQDALPAILSWPSMCLERLRRSLKPRVLAAHRTIVVEGEVVTRAFLVQQGLLTVEQRCANTPPPVALPSLRNLAGKGTSGQQLRAGVAPPLGSQPRKPVLIAKAAPRRVLGVRGAWTVHGDDCINDTIHAETQRISALKKRGGGGWGDADDVHSSQRSGRVHRKGPRSSSSSRSPERSVSSQHHQSLAKVGSSRSAAAEGGSRRGMPRKATTTTTTGTANGPHGRHGHGGRDAAPRSYWFATLRTAEPTVIWHINPDVVSDIIASMDGDRLSQIVQESSDSVAAGGAVPDAKTMPVSSIPMFRMRDSPTFRGLVSDDDVVSLVRRSTFRRFGRGHTIYFAGDSANCAYIAWRGTLEQCPSSTTWTMVERLPPPPTSSSSPAAAGGAGESATAAGAGGTMMMASFSAAQLVQSASFDGSGAVANGGGGGSSLQQVAAASLANAQRRFLNPNDSFGEEAVIMRTVREDTVSAVTDCVVLEIPAMVLHDIMMRNPSHLMGTVETFCTERAARLIRPTAAQFALGLVPTIAALAVKLAAPVTFPPGCAHLPLTKAVIFITRGTVEIVDGAAPASAGSNGGGEGGGGKLYHAPCIITSPELCSTAGVPSLEHRCRSRLDAWVLWLSDVKERLPKSSSSPSAAVVGPPPVVKRSVKETAVSAQPISSGGASTHGTSSSLASLLSGHVRDFIVPGFPSNVAGQRGVHPSGGPKLVP